MERGTETAPEPCRAGTEPELTGRALTQALCHAQASSGLRFLPGLRTALSCVDGSPHRLCALPCTPLCSSVCFGSSVFTQVNESQNKH